MKKRILLLSSLMALTVTTTSFADNYYFRYHINGLKAVDEVVDGEDEINEEKGKEAWENFAEENNLEYGDWSQGINWSAKSLTQLPNEPYPSKDVGGFNFFLNPELTNVNGLYSVEYANVINFGTTGIQDISGLKNLRSVGTDLIIQEVPLTSLNGLEKLNTVGRNFYLSAPLNNIESLSNLESVGSLQLTNTNITDVDSLQNLKLVNSRLYFGNNPNLTDIHGLRNTVVNGDISLHMDIDSKLSEDTIFCSQNSAEQFIRDPKTIFCE